MRKSKKTFVDEFRELKPIPEVFWGIENDYEQYEAEANPFRAIICEPHPYKDPLTPPFDGDPANGHQFRELRDTGHQFREIEIDDVLKRGLDVVLSDDFGIDIDKWRQYQREKGDMTANGVASLGMDAFGCYLPWHAYGQSTSTPWGMYFFIASLFDYAALFEREANALGSPLRDTESIRLAFWAVYRHELFHFHVEHAATRQEIIARRPIFRPYVEKVRAEVKHTHKWLEEALAQAVVIGSKLIRGQVALEMSASVRRRLFMSVFDQFPEGYRDYHCKLYGGPEKAHGLIGAQLYTAREVPGYSVTDIAKPKREYAVDRAKVPGYFVLSLTAISQFQLQMPKRQHLDRYSARQRYVDLGPGPGDHKKLLVNNQTIQINVKGGEVDLASMKAMAKAEGRNLRTLLDDVRNT